MGLNVICNNRLIIQHINNFDTDYYEQFYCVRNIAKEYLRGADAKPSEQSAMDMTKDLIDVLKKWGAGKRRAPQPRRESEIADWLLDNTTLKSELGKIEGCSIPFLNININNRIILHGAQISDAGQFDQILLSVLNRLAVGLFVGNTNVIYPMKALLLISGLMPAFDKNVKEGFKLAGLTGVSGTQFLLPSENETGPNMKKLTRLPFLLGQCWSDFSDRLTDAIRQSHRPKLVEEPGRVFDILFFMQGQSGELIFKFEGPERWYEFS